MVVKVVVKDSRRVRKVQSISKTPRKAPPIKEYMFTVLENSADVSVSTYETTLKRFMSI